MSDFDDVAVPVDEPWRADAACIGHPIDLFFPGRGESAKTAQALAICAGCPVRTDCLDWALRTMQKFGVLGGTSERQRRKLRAQRRVDLGVPFNWTPPVPTDSCGTNAGYSKHHRERTPACQACREAHAAHVNAYRAARRAGGAEAAA